MALNLIKETPKRLRSIDNVAAMVRTIDRALCSVQDDIVPLPETFMDPQKVPAKLLGHKFADLGWDMDCLVLTEAQKRKLLPLIPIIYRQKGTLPGIVNLVRLLFGIEITATIEQVTQEKSWKIGFSKIGIDTFIGIQNPASFLIIQSPIDLTDEQIINIECVIDIMRVAGTQTLLDYPNRIQLEDLYFVVGKDKIGGGKKIGGEFGRISHRNYPDNGNIRETFNQ